MGCIRIFIKFWNGNALIGNFDLIGLQHVGFAVNDQLSPHIPFALFMLFQMMFCTIAVSILSGSIAERMKFFPFIIFIFYMGDFNIVSCTLGVGRRLDSTTWCP